jgi:hypothetical protein
MNRRRIFLGSSGKQTKLLQAITRGLKDVADVEPWTTTFNPGRSTIDRLCSCRNPSPGAPAHST